MKAGLGFELKLRPSCAALEYARLLGLRVSVEEEQKLLVEESEDKDDNCGVSRMGSMMSEGVF